MEQNVNNTCNKLIYFKEIKLMLNAFHLLYGIDDMSKICQSIVLRDCLLLCTSGCHDKRNELTNDLHVNNS